MVETVISILASAQSIPSAMEQITTFGGYIGLGKLACFETKVVVAEALNNIVCHTPKEDSAGSITIRCCLHPENVLEIVIQDQGQAFDLRVNEKFPSSLSEGGRGWPIIAQWTNSIEYQSQQGFNRLILKKNI